MRAVFRQEIPALFRGSVGATIIEVAVNLFVLDSRRAVHPAPGGAEMLDTSRRVRNFELGERCYTV